MYVLFDIGQTVPRDCVCLDWIGYLDVLSTSILQTTERRCMLRSEVSEQPSVIPACCCIRLSPVLIPFCSVKISIWQRLCEKEVHYAAQLQHFVCHHKHRFLGVHNNLEM